MPGPIEPVILVSEAAVAYSDTGADLTLTSSGSVVTSNVVTPPKGTTKLMFLVRLKSAAIMYLRSGGANGAVLSGASITADQWSSFETAWSPGRAFSVRFSATQANLYDLVIVAM